MQGAKAGGAVPTSHWESCCCTRGAPEKPGSEPRRRPPTPSQTQTLDLLAHRHLQVKPISPQDSIS